MFNKNLIKSWNAPRWDCDALADGYNQNCT